jgi:cytosine/adenosine deaminase-related metal-dependent hydrolase
MKRFSAQYIFTNSGPPLMRGIITADDEGKIIRVEDTCGNLNENQSVEFYNGIIIPGFVNCHCHLELSHLKGAIGPGNGLGDFLISIRTSRDYKTEDIIESAINADHYMYREGVNLCADICNTSLTFEIKKTSRICYVNLLEVFGIDPEKAGKRIEEIIKVAEAAKASGLIYFIVPHTVYSVSLPLFRLLKKITKDNKVTSIHFMETEGEEKFLVSHSGPLIKSYQETGLLPETINVPENHLSTIMDEVNLSGNLILVHNTFADKKTVNSVNKRGNTYWCLCPGSNLYIENKLPPVEMLKSEKCEIVTGTDSLASNTKLSILSEIKMLQENFPSVSLEELIRWATINGARALGQDKIYGSIESGKKPGLLLLQNADLKNNRLLPETEIIRLL